MNNVKLAICIPSFNRLEKAKECVKSLLEQIGDFDVSIQVIDNASDEVYFDNFSEIGLFSRAISDGRLSIIRNTFNIGMSANFMRSFEVANGSWLWIVADDDVLRADSIKSILIAIDLYSTESGFIVFGGQKNESTEYANHINSLEEFIDFNHLSTDVFNRFIFITNGVYKLDYFRPLLSDGYQHLNTYIPHFMMQVAYMRQGNKCIAIQENIVDYAVPEIGYSYSMVAGLGVGSPKHMLLKVNPTYYRKFLALFFPHNDYKVIIDLYFACKRDATLYVCRQLACNYLQYVKVSRTFPQMLALRFFAYILRFPNLFEYLILIIERFSSKIKRHTVEIRARYD